MSQATEAVKSVNDLEATVMYSVDTGVKPVNETFEHGNLIRRSTGGNPWLDGTRTSHRDPPQWPAR